MIADTLFVVSLVAMVIPPAICIDALHRELAIVDMNTRYGKSTRRNRRIRRNWPPLHDNSIAYHIMYYWGALMWIFLLGYIIV
jgi:hypothetical protein